MNRAPGVFSGIAQSPAGIRGLDEITPGGLPRDEDSILVMPTLVRRLPPPLRKIVGDLSMRRGT